MLILIIFVGYWLLNKASTICFDDFLSFFPNGTSFFWKNRPPSASTVGVSQQDLSVALRPEQRPIGDHGSQPNAAGAVRWSGWEVVRNPETIKLYNIYIYIYVCMYNCQLITYDMFDIIYIYMLDVKVFFPTCQVRASGFYQSCMPPPPPPPPRPPH